MKKFSFKKLATVSLFFTSIIFTSAFTTCFIPTISTSHSNDQPNATKIDLHDYNNKTLPKPFEKPDSPINQEQLITQLEEAEGNQSLPWVNWKCYPNQFKDFVPTLSDTGGSFTLTAKPNAVNYVGSSVATISFNYTDSSKTDISTIITNIQLTTDTNAFSATPSSQQLLTQLKQVNQNARINSLTVEPSTAVWDKTHVIIGDETHSGSYKVTVSVKPNDLIYTGTVDVYYLIKRSDMVYQKDYELPSIYTSWPENLIMFCDVNDLDVRSILEGEYSFDIDALDMLGGHANFLFNSSANPAYFDTSDYLDVYFSMDFCDPFELSASELNNQGLGWSGFEGGVCRFYEINKNTHHVGMIDSQIAQLSHDSDYFWGNDVVFGDKVRDSNGQEWTVTEAIIVPRNTTNPVYTNNYGAFGGSGISYGSDTFFGSVTINPSLFDISRCMFRMRTAITSFIIPSNSQLVAIGPCSIMGTGIESFTVPPQVKIVMYGAFDNLGNNQLPFYKLIFQTDFMVPFYGPDYNIDPNARPLGIVWQQGINPWDNGTGIGRILVKTEPLRQQYLNDPDWLNFLKPGPDTTIDQMVQVY